MDINRTCSLVLKDVYYYDIEACHYQLLKGLGYNLTSLNKNDKLQRNIQIGLWMRDNPRLNVMIRKITNSTINSYININEIKDDNIILKAYDGIVTTKKLAVTTSQLTPIELQHEYDIFIISSTRKAYIARTASYNNDHYYTIKGISHRYDLIDELIYKLLKINLSFTKKVIFNKLEEIKIEIFESKDPKLFCIPVKDKFVIFLKGYGETLIGKGLVKILDTQDIDRQKYFELYIRPFTESIVIEFI